MIEIETLEIVIVARVNVGLNQRKKQQRRSR
jgi:hypothetical protein